MFGVVQTKMHIIFMFPLNIIKELSLQMNIISSMARQLLWSLIRSALGKPKFIVCRNNYRLLSLKIFSFSLKFADKKDCQEDDVCSVNFICQEEEPGFSCDCPDGFQVIEGACTGKDLTHASSDVKLLPFPCHYFFVLFCLLFIYNYPSSSILFISYK